MRLRTIIINDAMRRCAAVSCALTLLYPALACGAAYRVTVTEALDQLSVEARFKRPTSRFTVRDAAAARYLLHAGSCDGGRPASARGRRLTVPAPGVRCLHYRVDLSGAAAAERRNVALDTAVRIASPAVWLWRPAAADDTAITVEFELPDAIAVAVPWIALSAERPVYRIPPSPESGSAAAAFGRIYERKLDVPGATLSLAILAPPAAVHAAKIEQWIAEAARNVSLAYGRFPNPNARVFVMPASAGRGWFGSPVPFGRVVRDGVEAVELFADLTRPLSEFRSDWTTTHEFSHLLLPYVRGHDRWIAEGFAQYYQNVLLARAGTYSPERAWFNILAGLERGRRARPDMSPNEAASRRGGDTRMKVYWAGAALMLMADVDLRRRTQGRTSLDTALERLQRCCLPSPVAWSGAQLMAQLDTPGDVPVFLPLYRRHADRPGFPDVAPLLEALGISKCGDAACLAADAELAELRDAILTAPDSVAAAL